MPSCVFDEWCTHYTDRMQLQRMLSQDWLQSWTRWLQMEDMITLYDHNQDKKQQSCKDVVVEVTSVSLLQMVVSFPSDEQSRCQLLSDGCACGDIDGVDYNCLTESLLQ